MRKQEIECCDVTYIHEAAVQTAREKMPCEQTLKDLADFYKVFADPTRVKLLCVLLETEMCVCDLAEVLKMTQSAISHQLRILKQARLVKSRREGKMVYYALADDHVRTIFAQGLDHILE